MKSKPIKGTDLKRDTVTKLEQKNIKLQIQIDGLKNKILKLENKTLKQEQQILKLQKALNKSEYEGGDIFLQFPPSSHKSKK